MPKNNGNLRITMEKFKAWQKLRYSAIKKCVPVPQRWEQGDIIALAGPHHVWGITRLATLHLA